MANKYVGAAQFVGEKIIKPIVKSFTKKQKTTGTGVIKNVPIAKNLTTKRNIQDKTVSAVDKGIKKADVSQSMKDSQKTKQYASEMKIKKSKELKDYSYKLDKLTEKKATGGRVGKMGGGFMGKRMGYKKGSKKFPDLTGDGKVTFADILKGRGVINGKKNKK